MKNTIKAIALILILFLPVSAYAGKEKKPQQKKTLRVLYWNIQNGMWAGQPENYKTFVEWIKSKDPDICVFCEGATIYYNGTHDHMPNEERYLPAHWGEFCARWGHEYHQVAPRRKSTSTPYGLSNYPDVVTSKYPIDSISVIRGSRPDSVVVNPALWVQVHVEGVEKPLNVIALHLKHGKFGYGVPHDKRKESAERYEGEQHRIKELTCILNGTVRKSKDPNKELWIMAGDFNSYSRKDNYHYRWNNASLGFQTQDFMIFKSPFFDLVAECYPDFFMPSCGNLRIDYMYVSKPMLNACSDVYAEVKDKYLKREHSGISTFYIPSDHYPIIADFKISKMK